MPAYLVISRHSPALDLMQKKASATLPGVLRMLLTLHGALMRHASRVFEKMTMEPGILQVVFVQYREDWLPLLTIRMKMLKQPVLA